MENWWQIDWREVFVPTVSLVEMVLRGTLVYLVLFAFLRLFRRGAGALGVTDLLVVVLIADAASNAMGRDYRSVTEGATLVATIAAWDYLLDWLGYRSQFFERVLRPRSLPLVRNGQMLRRNMRRELVTEEELLSQLRQQGIEDVAEVKLCALEGDGRISVITRKGDQSNKADKDKPLR